MVGAKRKGGVWDEVRQLVERGEHPVITLTAEQEVIETKGPRPRFASDERGKTFHHYLGNTRQTRSRPRCENRGCKNYLKRDDLWFCSEWCAGTAASAAREVLDKTGKFFAKQEAADAKA